MFGNRTVVGMIDRSAENDADRRSFLRNAGLAGLGALGASAGAGLRGMPRRRRRPATVRS